MKEAGGDFMAHLLHLFPIEKEVREMKCRIIILDRGVSKKDMTAACCPGAGMARIK
jgi:N-methylhydantoinase A/oxoprolinase/acetone carboxylase beta subunit